MHEIKKYPELSQYISTLANAENVLTPSQWNEFVRSLNEALKTARTKAANGELQTT